MSCKPLPHSLDLKVFSQKGEHYEGQLPLSTMKYLSDFLANDNGFAQVSLFCGYDSNGFAFIQIEISTQVQLICQRCLQIFTMPIETKSSLSPITHDDDAKYLPDAYEPVMLQNNLIEINHVVEDELILNLPIIAKHPPDECSVVLANPIDSKDQLTQKNPFSQLKKYLKAT